ncbi:MAG: hypothetical protein MUE73_19145 [Planctomycetes bacterium]|jgi:hypothetical protein|nr:hypothetical protein [Planctomycetota bacterium]
MSPSLSRRAHRFLFRVAASFRAPGDPSGALAILAAKGLPHSPEIAQFEAAFGGLRFNWRGREALFGIAAMHALDPDLRAGPDGSRVLVGREGEWTGVSMSADGRLWSHGPDDWPWPLAPSFARRLEHLALLAAVDEWCGDPFRLVLPPCGGEIAEALGLVPDATASDDHLAAFAGDAGHLLGRLRGAPPGTSFCELLCRDTDVAAESLLRLRRWRPDMGVAISGTREGRVEEYSRHGYAGPGEVPDPESWAGAQNAVRFRYHAEDLGFLGQPRDVGVVWLFGSPGAWRFEQYVRPGGAPDRGFVEWTSHAGGRTVQRRFIPVLPSRPPAPEGGSDPTG